MLSVDGPSRGGGAVVASPVDAYFEGADPCHGKCVAVHLKAARAGRGNLAAWVYKPANVLTGANKPDTAFWNFSNASNRSLSAFWSAAVRG